MKRKKIMTGLVFVILATSGMAGEDEAIRFDFSPPFLEKALKQTEKEKMPLAVPRCACPPSIDGKIMPDEWAKSATLEIPKTSQPTKVRLMFDDNAIYIAAECRVPARNGYAIGVAGGPAVQALQSVPTGPAVRDAKNIWREDHLEIWFQQAGKDSKKYQFAIGDLGGIADLIAQPKEDFSYDPDWPHAVGRNEYGWTAEMAIPKSALQIANWLPEIGFNIGRDGPHVKVCSWSGTWGDTSQKIKLEGSGKDEPQSIGVSEYRSAGVSEALSAKAERTYARPGDRWIEIQCKMQNAECRMQKSDVGGLMSEVGSNLQLTAEVYATGGNKPVAQGTITPPRAKGKVLVDLRTLGLKEAKLVLKLYNVAAALSCREKTQNDVVANEKTPRQSGAATKDSVKIDSSNLELLGTKEINLTAKDPDQPLKEGEKVKILIDVPEGVDKGENWPVMIGVPFPAGALWDADQVRLVDKNGKEIPSQKEVTGLWAPEGSIQWLRFDALVTPGQGCFMEIKQPTPPFRLRSESYGGQVGHPSAGGELSGKKSPPLEGWLKAGVGSLKLTEQDGKITIDTGISKYILGKGSSPIMEIILGGKKIGTSEKTRGLYVIDQTGRIGSASAEEETMLVEATGPVTACVRFEGWYKTEKGENLARHITRVECFAGQPFAKVTHTLVLTEDTNKTWFKDIGWEFAVTPGSNPQALFGISRSDPSSPEELRRASPQKSLVIPLDRPTVSAYMLQDQHYMFAHGTNHFSVAKIDKNGNTKILFEGDECGDFVCLAGEKAALMMACRETARQHPKEFEITVGGLGLSSEASLRRTDEAVPGSATPATTSKNLHGKITLHLFSNRAGPFGLAQGGEELDFRTAALFRKWDLTNWVEHTSNLSKENIAKGIEKIGKYVSNAAGWSKTHELLVLPMAAGDLSGIASTKKDAANMACHAPRVAAQYAWLNSHPVFALADPQWIYKSDVMGPLYPKDKQRFPEAERLIADTFGGFEKRIEEWGDFGFMDYFAGPHLEYMGKYLGRKRVAGMVDYSLRANLWLIYARSGERRIREFAEATNLKFGDVKIAHWEGPGKIKGLLTTGGGGGDNDLVSVSGLPFYWDDGNGLTFASSTDMHNLIWLYQLAGYRRARDMVLEFGEGIKRGWTPSFAKRDGYPMGAMLLCAQTYGLTWDPVLREIVDATMEPYADELADQKKELNVPQLLQCLPNECVSHLRKEVCALIDIQQILGNPRYHALAMRLCRYIWQDEIKWRAPISYLVPHGRIGSFLYRETGDLSYAEVLAERVREAESHTGEINSDACLFVFQGIPYAEDAIVRTGADKDPVVAWLEWAVLPDSLPASVVAWKSNQTALTINPLCDGVAVVSNVAYLKSGLSSNLDLAAIWRKTDQADETLDIPKEAPEGAYAIKFNSLLYDNRDRCMAVAHNRSPLVLHAPGYWMPAAPYKWFFMVPKDSKDAQITFMGRFKLYDPDGNPWQGGTALKGCLDLPAEKPGLWAMEPVGDLRTTGGSIRLGFGGYVHVRNIPPFFAMRDAKGYFTPEIPWEREAPYKAAEKPAPDTVYVPGAIETPENKALYLAGKRTFSLKAGGPHPSGGGMQFLPFKQGTIEFWFKPFWSTWEVPEKADKYILQMIPANLPQGENWYLHYLGDTFILNSRFMTGGPHQDISMQWWRTSTFFSGGEWVHLAWVWGPYPKNQIIANCVFINGKSNGFGYGGNRESGFLQWQGNQPRDLPKTLMITGDIEAAYDELRISDVPRYWADFTPPARDKEFQLDEHTRALFHFNGNSQGESYGQSASSVPGELK